MNYNHVPVLANEVIEHLNIRNNGIYVDGTVGFGGHSKLIAQKLTKNGKLIAIDRDEEALTAAKDKLKEFSNIIFINDNFINLSVILDELHITKVDGILFDLGVSSMQLDKSERGFSFKENPENMSSLLDMRMDKRSDFRAIDIINGYKEFELINIFYKYGEEPFSRRIAKAMLEERKKKKIQTVGELITIIKAAIPEKYRFKKGPNYASNIFRALRIEVNDELNATKEAIDESIDVLNPGGRLVIITFHSLEDRIVKHSFRDLAKLNVANVLTKKPILPSEEELKVNRRSASAKSRAIEKI